MMCECWDDDPDARLTAANILYKMEDLSNSSIEQVLQSYTSSTPQQNHATTSHQPHPPADISHVIFQEDSQSGPPPCYSPTDPIPFPMAQNQENISRMRQAPGCGYFQTSMPHILPTADEGRDSTSADVVTLTPGCTRSLRSSGQQSGWGQYHPPLSVRNSLVLGETRTQMLDNPLPTFSAEDSSSGSSSHSLSRIRMEHVAATGNSNSSSVLELDALQNADSGIQSSHSCMTGGSSPTDTVDITDTGDTAEITEMTQTGNQSPNHPVFKETCI
jgi:hypothetical protein